MEDSLLKFIVLVPLARNDGTRVEPEILLDFQEELLRLGGGYTTAGTVQGAYRMADGTTKIDHSLQYWVCIPNDAIKSLRLIVARLGSVLGQEAMYLERTESDVTLIPPDQEIAG